MPGYQNPTNLLSRGCSVETLKKSHWWEGPIRLRDSPKFWSKSQINPHYDVINSEKRKTVEKFNRHYRLQFIEKMSSYLKMIKAISWIYRYFTNVTKEKGEK